MSSEYLNSNAWPFVEARAILKRKGKALEKKGHVLFQTGYGPSGLPHIGTFGEVCRTTMVIQAFKKISDIPVKLFTFSDDMDGLRKVPDNIPNSDLLEKNLNKPLTAVPDPFGKFPSFGEHNNAMLKTFLDKFNFSYDFKSSTEMYKSGVFNNELINVLNNYEKIMNIILPTLGSERKKTYSPFLPICPETGKVLEIPIIEIDEKQNEVVFDNNGKKLKTKVTDGCCKLQWKVDWAMRWSALKVDFEMYGKDLIPSAELSGQICKTLGTSPPNGFAYELFLDEKGEKISKSKGNGITIEEWLKYATQESLALYMYQNPQRAKKLYPQVIPKAVDEYLTFLEKFEGQEIKEQLGNPVWHVHNGNPPKEKNVITFGVLLNLVSASNAESEDVLWKFIKNYNSNIVKENHPILQKLIQNAIQYFNDIVKPSKKYRSADENEKKALLDLIEVLKRMPDGKDPAEIQTEVFTVGKNYYPKEKLRDWFKAIYEIVFGDEQGPRMGSFISFFGRQETIKLLEDSLKR
ncbi:MAG: lysine--tRNA ligase [Pelagibacteraceae bacterium]|nr:lysine--tRNA ligase [Pelagibacteraceae bacterium]MCI5078775.1 lysine--tRNA ligase [Pelagibacteraceae bacterium]